MRKLCFIFIVIFAVSAMLLGCGATKETGDGSASSETLGVNPSKSEITQEMAYEGASQYCRSAYDWSAAEGNPDMMYLEMGEETESEYQVIFRSYTGAFVYFYVDKSSGNTRLTEYVPALGIETEAGSIDLYDYLK